jgi:2-haloacid dehalogenase
VQRPTGQAESVQALFFDVFGTVVDWRSGVARDAESILASLGYTLDWFAFADAWRAEYGPSMEEVRAGRTEYVRLDVLHRQNLERVLPRFNVTGLDEATLGDLNESWHRLDGWPDSTPGLRRLATRYLLAPVSNGHIALMVHLAQRNDFPWSAVLGAEIARNYKPHPAVYLASAAALDLEPSECMMVAAHSGDLRAAAELGLRTAHVARPHERGQGKGESGPSVPVDFAASSLEDLAAQLGV